MCLPASLKNGCMGLATILLRCGITCRMPIVGVSSLDSWAGVAPVTLASFLVVLSGTLGCKIDRHQSRWPAHRSPRMRSRIRETTRQG
jgi:hypothetical protein